MDRFSFTHVITLLSTVMQQLVTLSRGDVDSNISPGDRYFLVKQITETLDYLSDYISNSCNS